MQTFEKNQDKKFFKLVNENYSNLGNIGQLFKFKSNGHNSNIYLFETNNTKFLLKVLRNPDSMYGHNNGSSRIKLITEIIRNLSENYPLEKFVFNKFGDLTVNFHTGVLRVTKFIQNSEGAEDDFLKAINLLNLIHSEFYQKLNTKEAKILNSFSVPYELDYTIGKYDFIKKFLLNELKQKKSIVKKDYIKIILDNYELLFSWSKKLNILKEQKFFYLKSFTHNDFHPSNVIIDFQKKLHLLDFDNIQYSKTFRCLYFFLMRYSLNNNKLCEKKLENNYKILKSYYSTTIPSFNDSLMYMLYVEIEKILKILCRVSERKGLSIFVSKIVLFHLPNVKHLINLNRVNFY